MASTDLRFEHAKTSHAARDPERPSAARLRLAIAGCGRAVERIHLPGVAASRGWTLVGACDPREERREWLAAAADVPTFGELADLLVATQPDAVLVASPPATHTRIAVAALEAGAHVLVEKPAAADLAEALELRERSRSTGRLLAVAYNRRAYPGFADLRRRLAVARLDAPAIASAVLTTDPRTWCPVEASPDEPLGAVLEDLAPHHLDLVPWLLGSAVLSVSARPRGTSGVTVALELEGRSQAIVAVEHGPSYGEEVIVRWAGTTLRAGPDRCADDRWSSRLRRRVGQPFGRAAEALGRRLGAPDFPTRCAARQLETLADALAGRETFLATVDDAVSGAALLDACRRSLAQGGRPQAMR